MEVLLQKWPNLALITGAIFMENRMNMNMRPAQFRVAIPTQCRNENEHEPCLTADER